MAKTVVALAVGAAMAGGHIGSVDRPVSTWLPEWRDDPRGAIRLRELLSMSAGLPTPRYSLNPLLADAGFRFLLAAERTPVYLRTPLVRNVGHGLRVQRPQCGAGWSHRVAGDGRVLRAVPRPLAVATDGR
jgi:CubicO group peptidase (beta-lactamase class C family)